MRRPSGSTSAPFLPGPAGATASEDGSLTVHLPCVTAGYVLPSQLQAASWGSSSQGSSVGQAKAVSGSGQSLHWNAHDAGSEPRTSSTLWPPPVPLELLLLDALLLLLAEDV